MNALVGSLWRFRWAGVFMLGLLAYAPVVSLWFASDDFSHLFGYHQLLPGASSFTTIAGQFYRPVGTTLTWNLGYSLFGAEALPYHLISWILHACVAFLLARAVAVVSSDDRIGWIAGALFAVYPLCTESVAWVAAQWDVISATCALGAVWGFAVYWKTRDGRAYAAALAAFTVGVFTKESVAPLPIILPVVALVTEFCAQAGRVITPESRKAWIALLRRALLVSVPFFLPSLLFVILRLIFNGSIGGYEGARTDYLHFAWDAIIVAVTSVLMPLNRGVFDPRLIQVGGLAISGAFLLGLFAWGKQRWPLHLLAAVWWLVFITPVLNILGYDQSGGQNRLFYFSLMGLCISVAAIVASVIDAVKGSSVRWIVPALGCLLLAAAVPATWIQLSPWVQGSRQAQRLTVEMDRVLVPLPGKRLQLNVQDLPKTYKGAYVFLNGFDSALSLFANRITITKQVPQTNPAALAEPFDTASGISGVYNLSFALDEKHQLFHISTVNGSSIATKPPSDSDHVWDYLGCSGTTALGWQPSEADFTCASSVISPPVSATGYALYLPKGPDAIMHTPNFDLDLDGKTWVRVGILARSEPAEKSPLASWWWQPEGSGDLKRSNFVMGSNGNWRVYWTFVPTSQIGDHLQNLSFSLVDDQFPIDIGWISVKAIQ
ncbi:MAG: glycosyltransferase family 39 protein [Chloroflexia bacterium]